MDQQESKNYILGILCADDHAKVDGKGNRDGSPDVFADFYKRVMTGISINEISINMNSSNGSPE